MAEAANNESRQHAFPLIPRSAVGSDAAPTPLVTSWPVIFQPGLSLVPRPCPSMRQKASSESAQPGRTLTPTDSSGFLSPRATPSVTEEDRGKTGEISSSSPLLARPPRRLPRSRILKSALAEECQVQSICSTIYPSKPRARASTRTPYFSMIHDPSMPSMGRMLQWWASPFSIHHEPDG